MQIDAAGAAIVSRAVELGLSPPELSLRTAATLELIPVVSDNSQRCHDRAWRVEDARERAYVPANSIVVTLCRNNRGRRDKPGDDKTIESRIKRVIFDDTGCHEAVEPTKVTQFLLRLP